MTTAAAEVFVGEPELGPAPWGKYSPAVASDGRDFLVVWLDGRGGRDALLASRVSQSGAILDPKGILLSTAAPQAPRVIWTGDAYVVVWSTVEENDILAIMAARVDRDGRVLTQPRRVAENAGVTGGSYVATNGERIVIVYSRLTDIGFSATRALVLDTDLDVVGDEVLAGPDGASRYHPSIASNGGTFLAVWNVERNDSVHIEGMRLDENGAPIDAEPRDISTGDDPDLASDGSRFLLIVDVNGARAARTLDSNLATSDLRPLPGQQDVQSMSTFWTGTSYVFVANDFTGKIVTTKIAPDGTPATAQLTETGQGAAAATNGSRMLVAWIESTDDYRLAEIHARVFDTAAFVPLGEAERVSTSANEQTKVAVAFDGTNYYVVWAELDGIYGTRVSPGGQSLDGRGVRIATKWAAPRIVFDGATYIVAWIDSGSEIAARFVGTDGVPGTEVRVPAEFAQDLDLASGGTTSLLVWTTYNYRIRAARIERATQTISSPVTLTPPLQLGSTPSVSSNGIEYLVAWSEVEIPSIVIDPAIPNPVRIRGTRVLPSLSVRDANPLLLTGGDDFDNSPVLASNGTDWMMLWRNPNGLYARRITANGTPGAATRMTTASASVPDMKWDGERYVVAFHTWDERSTLFRAFVTNDGMPTAPQRIADTGSVDRTVSIARTHDGVVLAYTRWSWRPEHAGVNRAVLDLPFRKSRAVR